jgi:hypothetical protein
MTIFIARGIKWCYKFSLVARAVEIYFLPMAVLAYFLPGKNYLSLVRIPAILCISSNGNSVEFLLFSYPNSLYHPVVRLRYFHA